MLILYKITEWTKVELEKSTLIKKSMPNIKKFPQTVAVRKSLSLWLSGLMHFLRRSALLGLTGWRPATAWVQSPVKTWVSQLVGLIVGMLRLISRTGTGGLPVSSLNCDRPLHSGIRASEL